MKTLAVGTLALAAVVGGVGQVVEKCDVISDHLPHPLVANLLGSSRSPQKPTHRDAL